jgi:hypothetical protein
VAQQAGARTKKHERRSAREPHRQVLGIPVQIPKGVQLQQVASDNGKRAGHPRRPAHAHERSWLGCTALLQHSWNCVVQPFQTLLSYTLM